MTAASSLGLYRVRASSVQCDPPASGDIRQPDGVLAVVREVIGVPLDGQAGVAQDGRETMAEITIL